ncbi:superoxide dismutase (cu-zn) [Lichtheimia corymbifera JMRC:FSU:9682]|uniref:Superoxide dismutase [Cu-Zn] n=1 Tax=Lichtheimia corymbifera JMRC:FSU:9682 TaxID=1263082 RepID=A0A068RIC5_9FUNG|nr:superoxide dismutase (cu-zn) [Lichtheimia corymbifera JMRC:FSU:9682]
MVNLRTAVAAIVAVNSTISGFVRFSQCDGEHTKVHFELDGLEPGTEHGVHVHEFGDMSDGCTSMGAHYNPFNVTHGGPFDKVRHQGDFGNVKADENGHVSFDLTDPVATLHGPRSILGRGIVVHADRDDLGRGNFEDSKTTGHAGARLGCGIIAVSENNQE